LFPFVSGNNPFNPCNTLAGGVDCNAAYNNVLLDPTYLANFQAYYNNPNLGSANCFGIGDDPFCNPATFGLLAGPAAQTTARPVIGVQGDRNVTDVTLRQTHLVAGVRGDLPMMNFGDFKDWSFEASAVHSFADGNSSRTGIRGDRLNFALGNDQNGSPVGNTPCDPTGQTLTADVITGCVPVNLFSPSLYLTANGGTFASQAETDYLFDTRDFDTHTALTTLDASIQGDVLTLPGGDVSLLVGAQWRKDHLNSQPDAVASEGLFFGFFSDQGGVGDRTTKEVYGEAFIPLGLGRTGFREFNVEIAGRLTDDEFYGTNETYSIKAGYRPVDSLLVRGTYGTSFKAPNLRQLFLAGQTGFGTLSDPCAVPDAAYNALTMSYNPALDSRTATTLANCVSAGVDPTSFLAGQFSSYSVEINSGGATDLDPETSKSYTLGFSFDQPFTDAFDLEFGATYYNIDIESTIIEPGAGFIINDCYNQVANFGSAFCSRIERDFNDVNNPGVIDLVDAGFINRDQEVAKGVDYNLRINKDDVALFGTNFDFFGRLQANNNHSRKRVDIINGVTTEDQLVKEFGFPKWRGNGSVGFNVDRWSAAWTTRYQTEVTVDEEFIPAFGAGDTCLGTALGDVDCRGVFSAGDYWHHTVSAGYEADSWSILVGVSNVLKTDPPLVSPFEVFSVVNVPIGNGYDLNGREYFVRLNKRFN
jgi:iron complex outermembrane receptor protein